MQEFDFSALPSQQSAPPPLLREDSPRPPDDEPKPDDPPQSFDFSKLPSQQSRKLTRTSGNPQFDQLYEQAGAEAGVNPDLLLEQGRVESMGFNPKYIYQQGATSPKGAGGIAQFMPGTAPAFNLRVGNGVDDRYNPALAIPAQARMMRQLIDKHNGNVEAALAAYNSGSNLSTQDALYNRQHLPETRKYVDKITGAIGQQTSPEVPTTADNPSFDFSMLPSQQQSDTQQGANTLLIGDSIGMGLAPHLQQSLGSGFKSDVEKSRPIQYYTEGDHLQKLLTDNPTAHILISLGANNVDYSPQAKLQMISKLKGQLGNRQATFIIPPNADKDLVNAVTANFGANIFDARGVATVGGVHPQDYKGLASRIAATLPQNAIDFSDVATAANQPIDSNPLPGQTAPNPLVSGQPATVQTPLGADGQPLAPPSLTHALSPAALSMPAAPLTPQERARFEKLQREGVEQGTDQQPSPGEKELLRLETKDMQSRANLSPYLLPPNPVIAPAFNKQDRIERGDDERLLEGKIYNPDGTVTETFTPGQEYLLQNGQQLPQSRLRHAADGKAAPPTEPPESVTATYDPNKENVVDVPTGSNVVQGRSRTVYPEFNAEQQSAYQKFLMQNRYRVPKGQEGESRAFFEAYTEGDAATVKQVEARQQQIKRAARQVPVITADDLAWHLGMDASTFNQLSPQLKMRVQQALSRRVAADKGKQNLPTPTVDEQNTLRQQLGLVEREPNTAGFLEGTTGIKPVLQTVDALRAGAVPTPEALNRASLAQEARHITALSGPRSPEQQARLSEISNQLLVPQGGLLPNFNKKPQDTPPTNQTLGSLDALNVGAPLTSDYEQKTFGPSPAEAATIGRAGVRALEPLYRGLVLRGGADLSNFWSKLSGLVGMQGVSDYFANNSAASQREADLSLLNERMRNLRETGSSQQGLVSATMEGLGETAPLLMKYHLVSTIIAASGGTATPALTMALVAGIENKDKPALDQLKGMLTSIGEGSLIGQFGKLNRGAAGTAFGLYSGGRALVDRQDIQHVIASTISGGAFGAGMANPDGLKLAELPTEVGKAAIKSDLTPEYAKDVVASVTKLGKGVVYSSDGRALSLYLDSKTGEVFGNELTQAEGRRYDPAILTGEQRPIREAEYLSPGQFDVLARSVGVRTSAKPVPRLGAAPTEVPSEKNITPDPKAEALSRLQQANRAGNEEAFTKAHQDARAAGASADEIDQTLGIRRGGESNVNQSQTVGASSAPVNPQAETGAVSPDVAPVPEHPETLQAQVESAANPDSPRVAVFYPKSSPAPEKTPGFVVVPVDGGVLQVKGAKARALGLSGIKSIQNYVRQNGFESLIGKVAPVADTSQGTALRTEDANGRELSSSIVPTPEAAQAQAEVDRQQFPQSASQELMPAQEAAQRRIAENQAMPAAQVNSANPLEQKPESAQIENAKSVEQPRQWQHADFGLVTETENQSGVGTGRVRVVDSSGDEHVIQTANGRGEGNALATPVRRRGMPTIPKGSDVAPRPIERATPEAATPAEAVGAKQPNAFIRPGSDRGVIIAPSSKNPGKMQVTRFDANGFSSDYDMNTLDEALRDVRRDGYTEVLPSDRMSEIVATDDFRKGNETTRVIQKHNMGEISWEDAHKEIARIKSGAPSVQSQEQPAPQTEPPAAQSKAVAPESAKGLTRNFRAGINDASMTFASPEQRDLYDYGANTATARGSGQNPRAQAATLPQIKQRLLDAGIPEQDLYARALDVRNDVKAQMKGIRHNEERRLVDNTSPTPAISEQGQSDIERQQKIDKAASRKPRARPSPNPAKHNLFQYVALSGGVKPSDAVDLSALKGIKHGIVPLVNQNGKNIEDLYRNAVDDGYLPGEAQGGNTEDAFNRSGFTIDDFVNAIAESERSTGARGNKSHYSAQNEIQQELQTELEDMSAGEIEPVFSKAERLASFLENAEVSDALKKTEAGTELSSEDLDNLRQIAQYQYELERADYEPLILEAIQRGADNQARSSANSRAESSEAQPSRDTLSPQGSESLYESDAAEPDGEADTSFDFGDSANSRADELRDVQPEKQDTGLISQIKEMYDADGKFARGTSALQPLYKNKPDSELIDALRWTRSQDAWTARFVGDDIASELRKRGVPVDEIKWQIQTLPEPKSKQKLEDYYQPTQAGLGFAENESGLFAEGGARPVEYFKPPANATKEQREYAERDYRDRLMRSRVGDDQTTELYGLVEDDSPVRSIAAPLVRALRQVDGTKNAKSVDVSRIPDTIAALKKLNELRRADIPVDDYLKQDSLFTKERELTPEQESILSEIDRTGKLPNGLIQSEEQPEEASLFDSPLKMAQAAPTKESPTFFSQLQRTIEQKMPNRASAEQVRALITNPQNGVKPDEIKWTGLDDYLQGKESVTKQDVLDYLQANNVKVEEVVKGAPAKRIEWERDINKFYDSTFGKFTITKINESDFNLSFANDGVSYGSFHSLQEAQDAALSFAREKGWGESSGDTKFSQYTLPGAKEGSYRELLLTLPRPFNEPSPYHPKVERMVELQKKYYSGENMTNAEVAERDALNLEIFQHGHDNAQKIKEYEQRKAAHENSGYRSSHFDEPNILAHIRFDDRTDADGKRVMFLEELQSDWHQAGRKRGYKDTALLKELEQAKIEADKASQASSRALFDLQIANGDDSASPAEKSMAKLEHTTASLEANRAIARRQSLEQRVREMGDTVPDAPFKKTWHELALRRALRYAAENGYDKLAITTGEMQAERYDLSKQVRSIGWGWQDRSAGIKSVTISPTKGNVLEFALRPDGTVAGLSGGNSGLEFDGKHITDVVGKEIGEKMLADSHGDLSGDGLKVGGEGMRGFYDRIIPSYLSKYGKKWGARVGETELQVGHKSKLAVTRNESGYFAFDQTTKERLSPYFPSVREADAWVKNNPTKPTTVHSIDITPSMKKSVMEEGQPLFMARPNSPDLSKVENYIHLLPSVQVSRGTGDLADVVTVNEHAAEILRRALDQIAIDRGETEGEEASFDALFRDPKEIRETASVLRRKAGEMLEFGYTKEEAQPLLDIAKHLIAAGKAGKGTLSIVTTAAPPAALPHESFHQGSFEGAQGKVLSERHSPEKFEEMAATPAQQKWREFYRHTPEYHNASDYLATEETAAMIAGGDYHKANVTDTEAAEFLELWTRSFRETNGPDSFANFRRQEPHVRKAIEEAQRLAHYPEAESADATSPRARAGGEAGRDLAGFDAGGETGGLSGLRSATEGTTGSTTGRPDATGELKPRALPATLREQGLHAADELYETYPNRAALTDGKNLLEKLGFDGAEKLLRSGNALGAEHVALSKMMQRALLSEASRLSESDPDMAANLRERELNLASDLASSFTKAGQMIQAAQLLDNSVEGVMTTAQKIARERGRELTDKEATRIQQVGEELERSTSELEDAGREVRDERERGESSKWLIDRADSGLLTPAEVDTLKKQLASLQAKTRNREQRLKELDGLLPPTKARRTVAVRSRQRALERLSREEFDLMAEVKSALQGSAALKMARASKGAASEINKREWWHVPPDSESALKERGKFYSSSFEDAELYGVRADAKPEKINISNPLIGDEAQIEQELLGTRATLPEAGTKEFYTARTKLDRKLALSAARKGYDAIALLSPTGFENYQRSGRLPKSVELNTLHDLEVGAQTSPIRWVGGKRQFLPALQRIFEPYKDRRLVEPFFGSGTVSFGLQPKVALANDYNTVLANFHRRVAEGMEYDLPYQANKEDFAQARDRYNELIREGQTDTVEAAKLFYYLNQTAHGGLYRVNSKGEFNVSFQADKAGKPLRSLSDYRGQYKGIEIGSGDFEKVKVKPNDFIYSDPPYDSEFSSYQAGGFGWDNQVRHAEWLAGQDVPVVTQNEATPRILALYNKLGFDVWQIPARRSISRDASNRGVGSATEMIAFKNVPPEHIEQSLEGTGASPYTEQSPLKMAVPSAKPTPPLSSDTINKLARLGAIKLLRADLAKYSVSDFKREMLSDYGAQVKPHLDEIHTAAVKIKRAEMRRARDEAKLEAISERPGNEDLERDELEEIARQETEATKRAATARREHEKAARAFEKSSGLGVPKGLTDAIGRHAANDLEAIAAAKLALAGMTPERFNSEMRDEHGLTPREARDVFVKGGQVLASARADVRESKRMAAVLRESTRTGEQDLDEAQLSLEKKRVEKRDAERQVARELKHLSEGKGAPVFRAVMSLARDGLLTAKGLLRIASGMSIKQAVDAVARIGEGAIDRVESRALGLPRTSGGQSVSGLVEAIAGMPKRAIPAVKAAMKGESSALMPAHEPPTANPYVNLAVSVMQRLYGSKEAILRSFAHPEEFHAKARLFALNDLKDKLIMRTQLEQRTVDYMRGLVQFEGQSNQRLAKSLAGVQARYELRTGEISKAALKARANHLAKNPQELISALAMQNTERQVYANPSYTSDAVKAIRQGLSKIPGVGKAFDVAQTVVMPFVKRPANSISDLLTSYTGLRFGVETARSINSIMREKGWNEERRAAFNKAAARGAVGWGLIGIGAALAAAGLLTPECDDDSAKKNVAREAGYQCGALHIGGRYYKVTHIPFAGWLLGIGATWEARGAKAVPGAFIKMISEHPLLRGLTEASEIGKDIKSAVAEGGKSKAVSQLPNEAAKIASRLIPSPLAMLAEAFDTKEREQKGALSPFLYRLPGARNTLPTQRTVFGNEIDKSRFSVIDPFSSTADRSTPATKELLRLGVGVAIPHAKKDEGAEQLKTRSAAEGKAIQAVLDRAVQLKEYRQLPDDQKQEALTSLVTLARKRADDGSDLAAIPDSDLEYAMTQKELNEAAKAEKLQEKLDDPDKAAIMKERAAQRAEKTKARRELRYSDRLPTFNINP